LDDAIEMSAGTINLGPERRYIVAIGGMSFTPEGCPYRKSDSAIMVMKSAEDGRRYDATHVLDGAMERSVFVERPIADRSQWSERLALFQGTHPRAA
jgi:hypothetical protein